MADVPDIQSFAGSDPGFLSFKRGQNYYTSSGRRIADFFVGLVGVFLFAFVFYYFVYFLLQFLLSWLMRLLRFNSYFAIILIVVLLDIVGIVLTFVYGRKWLGIGAIVGVVLLPFLALLLLLMMWGL